MGLWHDAKGVEGNDGEIRIIPPESKSSREGNRSAIIALWWVFNCDVEIVSTVKFGEAAKEVGIGAGG